MKIKELNDAKRISFSIEIGRKFEIVIDKESNKIFENNTDVTQECLDVMSQYTIGDIVIGSPYKGGMVVAKILQGNADRKCLQYLNSVADNIILE